MSSPTGQSTPPSPGDVVLFDFSDPAATVSWRSIDDRVMGGLSNSRMTVERGFGLFSGRVSFDNFGGFASVRTEPAVWDLSNFTGMALEVRGDGKFYKLSLTTDQAADSVVYRARFHAPRDWSLVRIPFSQFVPTFRGSKVPDASPLDPSHVTTVGLLISDRQEGPFRLEVRKIAATVVSG